MWFKLGITLATSQNPNLSSDSISAEYKSYLKGIITINVPVVHIARNVMILIQEIFITRAMEVVGPEIETFLGPDMATSEASVIWAQTIQIAFFDCLRPGWHKARNTRPASRNTLPNCPVEGQGGQSE